MNCYAYAMDTELIRTLRETLATYPLAGAYLFGSAARGEQHAGSDIDIALIPQPGSSRETG